MCAQHEPICSRLQYHLDSFSLPCHTILKPVTSALEIPLILGQASLSDSDEMVSTSYFEIPILDEVSFAVLSSGNFHGMRRVGREGGKVREGWLSELVTSGVVRKTPN